MIKFFRKIRFELMEKNKTGKYLKYAFGEIVLVVIGILIALQINNWNENRLSKIKSVEFHQRLAEELEAVIERSDNDQQRAGQLVEYLRKSVEILDKGVLSESTKDTLDFTLQNFFQFVRINGELKTFKEMESTGQLGLIYNKDLKKDIFEYLDYLEAVSKIFDQMANKVNSTDIIDRYVAIKIGGSTLESKVNYDFQELSNDRFLINTLSRYGYFWQTKQYFSEILSKLSADLKESILKDLDK